VSPLPATRRPADRRWRRLGPPLVWDGEPGEGAVFDPVSGETHFLSQLPALILTVVDDRWCGYPELIARLAGPVALDGQAEEKVISALASLERAELVESELSATE